MNILYIVSEYPKVSHSFVRREILSAESSGHDITRVAIRGWDLPLVDETDLAERKRTLYVLNRSKRALLGAALRTVLSQPGLFISACMAAAKMSKRAEKSLPFHVMYLLEACWIARQPQAIKCEHIHAHFGTNPAEVAILVGILLKRPCSFTVHGPDEFDRPQAYHLATKIALSKFVVAVSSFGRSQLMRWSRSEDWSKIKIVHCGLDAAFLDQASSTPPTPRRLVCVGRLSGQKGQLLLLQAAALLHHKGIPFELILAGDGEMRPEIEQAIRALGLQECVRITGWISADQVRDQLMQAQALVLPSFAEGLPVVIMESMAVGRPVISTYIAGIPELVQHGVHGWLVPAGDVASLAEAMQTCLEATPSALSQMGEAARTRVRTRHNIQHEVEALMRHVEGNVTP